MFTYIPDNKEYIIKFTKKKLILDKENYIYNIEILNMFNTTLLSINLSSVDMFNLIDNIEIFLNYDTDLMYSISNCNEMNYIIGLNQYYMDEDLVKDYNDFHSKDIMTIYSTDNEYVNKILSFEITNTSDKLFDTLVEIFNLEL